MDEITAFWQNALGKTSVLGQPVIGNEDRVTVASVEPEDLSRFEGEGGPEAPAPATELIDVPLENAVWRRPPWTTHPTNIKNKQHEAEH